jgi:hypothetical protein
MKPFLFSLLAWLAAYPSLGQQATGTYQYEPVTEDYFKGYKNAKLKLDYYFTDGSSTGNRYVFELVLVDNLLMLSFDSPQTDDYAYISYQKKILLSDSQLTAIKVALAKANLKQRVKGIPKPDGTAHTKEVLIVKYRNLALAGGMAYANRACFPDSESEATVQQQIRQDRRRSSSINGNYDILIRTLLTHFTDLTSLKREALTKPK